MKILLVDIKIYIKNQYYYTETNFNVTKNIIKIANAVVNQSLRKTAISFVIKKLIFILSTHINISILLLMFYIYTKDLNF